MAGRSVILSIAQFSEPTSECPHGPGCGEACNLHKGSVMSLCDAQKLAWKAYGKPAPGTLIPIGSDNRIITTGSSNNSGPLLAQAERLGQREKESMPAGERLGIY